MQINATVEDEKNVDRADGGYEVEGKRKLLKAGEQAGNKYKQHAVVQCNASASCQQPFFHWLFCRIFHWSILSLVLIRIERQGNHAGGKNRFSQNEAGCIKYLCFIYIVLKNDS